MKLKLITNKLIFKIVVKYKIKKIKYVYDKKF